MHNSKSSFIWTVLVIHKIRQKSLKEAWNFIKPNTFQSNGNSEDASTSDTINLNIYISTL